jgi:hypothetical protein
MKVKFFAYGKKLDNDKAEIFSALFFKNAIKLLDKIDGGEYNYVIIIYLCSAA